MDGHCTYQGYLGIMRRFHIFFKKVVDQIIRIKGTNVSCSDEYISGGSHAELVVTAERLVIVLLAVAMATLRCPDVSCFLQDDYVNGSVST